MTGVGEVRGRPVVLVATVPAGGGVWYADTVAKLLRAQEIALRQAMPIVYVLEGGRLAPDLPDGFLPGGYGPGRALALAARLRRSPGSRQLAVRAGPMTGPAAILAELADLSLDLDRVPLAQVRDCLAGLPGLARLRPARRAPRAPARSADRLGDLLPADHRRSYDMVALLEGLLDARELDEFQPRHGAEMLCAFARLEGLPLAVIANRRGVIPARVGPPRLGGIIYTESAGKTAYFIETASRQSLPILFVHDVSGFMVGVEAEHSGIIRAGAGLVEAMAAARSPRIALTVNHASGAGYYAMAAQGFEPDFALAWPTGRIGAMEAEAAISAAHGTALGRHGGGEAGAPAGLQASIARMRATFERELEAGHAARRGHVDAVVSPEGTRATLAALLRWTNRPALPLTPDPPPAAEVGPGPRSSS